MSDNTHDTDQENNHDEYINQIEALANDLNNYLKTNHSDKPLDVLLSAIASHLANGLAAQQYNNIVDRINSPTDISFNNLETEIDKQLEEIKRVALDMLMEQLGRFILELIVSQAEGSPPEGNTEGNTEGGGV